MAVVHGAVGVAHGGTRCSEVTEQTAALTVRYLANLIRHRRDRAGTMTEVVVTARRTPSESRFTQHHSIREAGKGRSPSDVITVTIWRTRSRMHPVTFSAASDIEDSHAPRSVR